MEERLQKVLARAGVSSRRKAEELILEGRVSVNGRAVRELGTKVDPTIDEIAVDTVPIPKEQAEGDTPRTYILLYKPDGVVCTAKDTHGRQTVLDLVPPFPGKRLYPVGRLDEDSEGLVLLTNDGDLTARLTHPRYGVPKVYEVRVKGRITRADAEKFEKGVWLSEGRTGASRVFIERAGRETSHVQVTLTEGRNREIRRAFAKLEFPVLSIRRMQIGPVVGRGLLKGQYRPLADDEVAALKAAAAGEGSNRPMRRGGRRPGPRQEGDAPAKPRRRPGKPDPALHAPRHDWRDGKAPRRPRGDGPTRPADDRKPGGGRPPRGPRRDGDAPRGPRSGPGGRPPRFERPDGDRPRRGPGSGGPRRSPGGRPGGRPGGDRGRPGGGRSGGDRPSGGRPGGGRGRR